MRFDLSDLRLFLQIVEAGSITRGAERLHLAIAAASTRIRNMEAVLGTPLLHRERQGVQPTPAGRTLVHHARLLLQQAERMHGELAQYAEGIKGQVRLMSNTNALTEFLPEPLSDFLATHPQVNIDLEERLSDEIVAAVADGTADVGIVAGTVELAGLETLPFRTDRFVLVAAPAHSLATVERALFAEVLDYDFVGLDRSSALQRFLAEKGSGAASNCACNYAALMRCAAWSSAMSGSASFRRPRPSGMPRPCRSIKSSWRTTGRSASSRSASAARPTYRSTPVTLSAIWRLPKPLSRTWGEG